MKRRLLIISVFIMAAMFCHPQVNPGVIGINFELSADSQYLKAVHIAEGFPGDIYGLKYGDRIYTINDTKVRELANPVNEIKGLPGTYVKLGIRQYYMDSIVVVSIPRILPVAGTLMSEGQIASNIHSNINTDQRIPSSMAVLADNEVDFYKYRTFDFDYSSADDPLLEKELFKILEKRLIDKGMIRDKTKPDVLILMKFFSGQKEQYIPPQQIVSTRVQTIYDWRWGLVPMPITQTNTQGGYTEVTYLTSISLKFLDANLISTSKLPPVLWSGSISQASKNKMSLIEKCDHLYGWLLFQFPYVTYPNSEYNYGVKYAYTGIIYNKNDLRTVAGVIPGSPAAEAGIQKGDEIVEINNYKIHKQWSDVKENERWLYMVYKYNLSGFRYLFMFADLIFKPYGKEVSSELEFRIKREGSVKKIEVRPQSKMYYKLIKGG